MLRPSPAGALPVATAVLLGLGAAGDAPRAGEPAAPAARLAVVDRSVAMDRGEWIYWQVDYRLRNLGPGPLVIAPGDVEARLSAWVSNSRAPGHDAPVHSELTASGRSGLIATCDILPSGDEAKRCRERLILQAWPAASGDAPPEPIAKAGARAVLPEEQPAMRLAPGEAVRVRLRLEHEHHLYGPFHALLGTREVELRIGPARLVDEVPLDRERKLARSQPAWPPAAPPEYLDDRVFLSAPDSVHLDANIPGRQSYRFPDFRRARGGSRMRLSFWYLVAPGTDGECQARVVQFCDLPNRWKTLSDGEVDERLTTVGRWVHVQRVFKVEPEASSLAVDFRILGADLVAGELWIDDVHLEALGDGPSGP
jgi:hypothetical protein